MAQVTFTKPIDHYAPGDVREIDKDEAKRLETYAERWNIKDYFVKGKQTLEAPKEEVAPKPSKTTATVSSDGGKTKGNKPAAPKAPVQPKEPKAPVTPPQTDKKPEDETDPAKPLPQVDGTVAKDGDKEPKPASKPEDDKKE